ncbi:MAG TPA: histidine phosphatase family protein, partial [Phycisphaerales bacterium]|nr:histidine phosphatase family protein [Phycisphaerales bacterium]
MGKQTGIQVVLVRSGRTEWDDAGRLQGVTDLPLSESGRSALGGQLGSAFGGEGWPELGVVY